MANLLILYNPYYQSDVIEQHLEVLKSSGKVAFGKVKSKIKNQIQEFSSELAQIYQNTNEQNPLQLFLSDYANLFVAKVIKVCKEADEEVIPRYYKEKGLEVEDYFIITDLRELVREDFTLLRDKFLSNFTTPNYGGHSYAIYGNKYVYPLIINQKREIFYFNENRHYLNVYKSEEYLAIQRELVEYVFGERLFYLLHPDSISHFISAEIELRGNRQNPLYDFTSIVVKYSKILEYEFYDYARAVLRKLVSADSRLLEVTYSMQGVSYNLEHFFKEKPNLGTIRYLLKQSVIQERLEEYQLNFINREFSRSVQSLQKIRNPSVHQTIPKLEEVLGLRSDILGIERFSILKNLLLHKERIYGTR